MRKNFILWAVVAAAIFLGAAGRILLHHRSSAGEDFPRRTVIIFEGESEAEGDSYGFDHAHSKTDEGAGFEGQKRKGPPLPSEKGRPSQRPPDLSTLKEGVSHREGNPGDMRDYLEDSERARRARIGKSLEEIKRKVKDWRPSIFEPTW